MANIKTYKPVTYFEGISQFSAQPAALVWTDEDHLILDVVDENNVPVRRVFDIPISKLVVGGSSAVIWFLVDGKKHRVDFSFGARLAMAGGVAGMVISGNLIQQSGVLEWVNGLTAHGAASKYITYGKLLAWSFALAFALVAVVTVVVVAISISQSGF